MFTEKQIVRGHRSGGTGFSNIVDVYTTTLDVLSGLAFGWTQARLNEQFDERQTDAIQFGFFDFFGRHFTDNAIKNLF